MERLSRVMSAAFVGLTGVFLMALPVDAQTARVSTPGMQAHLVSGSVSGTVLDDRGAALGGAMVSALGGTLASTVTDERGRFTFRQLPPGEYLLRAHMSGFAASPGTRVRVGDSAAEHSLELKRLTDPRTVAARPVGSRPIIAAGVDLPRGPVASEDDSAEEADHPHDETAWRLRHIKRSILKDSNAMVVLTEVDAVAQDGSLLERAVGSAANLATSVLTDLPFTGEVNFLTTGAAAPGELLSATAFPRGVAYLALTAPGSGGDWSVRAAMSEGDLSSWIVAGSYASRPRNGHMYNLGLSYSTQEYMGGNPAALAAVTDGSRNVGELYAFDEWTISPAFTIEYGGRYGHYDYLEHPGQFSPRFRFTVGHSGTRVRASVEQRKVVPGADEFLARSTPGPSLPPERTFAPLGGGGAEGFRVERARSYDVVVEKDLGEMFVVGVERFRQSVDDQLVTIFGLPPADGARAVGHYYVSSAGSVDATGWALRFDTRPTARIQGSVHYAVTRASWTGGGDLDALLPVAPAAVRPDVEDFHDVTSSLRADIAETATRVFVVYKLNSGFVRSNTAPGRPGVDGRFEVQVNQALPLTFAGTKWEVLVGLRNLFRDPTDSASVYDELLVVRPPKRLVGGVLVRF